MDTVLSNDETEKAEFLFSVREEPTRTYRSPRRLAPGDPAHDCDRLLPASRRLDWRFLLPNPELRNVLYVGPAHGALWESLRLFSASLTVVDEPQLVGGDSVGDVGGDSVGDCAATGSVAVGDASHKSNQRRLPDGPYDLAVIAEPSRETLCRTAEWVAPGGCLYVEARRRPWSGRSRRGALSRLKTKESRLRHASDLLATVSRLGFVEVDAYWHWPNFESCAEIVPLGDRAALAHSLARRTGGTAARLKAIVGRGLLQIGLFARQVSCFSVVARKGTG